VTGCRWVRLQALFSHPTRAAECAEQQGHFVEFVDAVFDKQDSLGLKSWASYAQDAKVPNLTRYVRCVEAPGAFARIDSGLIMAERAGVRATPTVFVNGWRFPIPPTSSRLSRAVSDLLGGLDPVSDPL
jgi:protein-disulfide isomerase